MKRDLPQRTHAPSGRELRLEGARARVAAGKASRSAPSIERTLEILGAEGVLTSARGEAVDVDGLELRDFHYLRALCIRAGLVDEAPRREPCENCGEVLDVRAASAFEPGPFVDGELDDPELDAPFDFDVDHAIPPIRVGKSLAKSIRLAPRTVGQARRLLVGRGALALDRSVVAALGVVRLGAEPRATVIVRALTNASDEAFAEVLALYEDAHYSPRMAADVFCLACSARNTVPVPTERELDRIAPADEREHVADPPEGFPSLDRLEAMVRRDAARVFRGKGLRNIDVVVDDGVAWVDDGGEPLLGCYVPPSEADGLASKPEIRIFYRTFAAEARHDPAFDVEAEIYETLDHEAQHHLYFLAGADPMDAEERDEIQRERARIVGKAELARRGARTFVDDFLVFAKIALPIVLVLVGLSIVRSCA
ncbi:MAG TPA: hypothetical protein VL400_21885 [Polyangiaceae bacterium]|nr:hypothetical protein [Polyangiaceae bacterium]